jgi:hypothetical protein
MPVSCNGLYIKVVGQFQERTSAAKAAAIPEPIYGTAEAVPLSKTSKTGHLSVPAPIYGAIEG